MTTPDIILARLREQRSWLVEVAPGKRVKLIRPTQLEMQRHLIEDGYFRITFDEVVRFTVGWDGFTEADLMGADVGASDAVLFDADLWKEIAAENLKWVNQLADELLAKTTEHLKSLEANEKN
jgi:hypothetical protein